MNYDLHALWSIRALSKARHHLERSTHVSLSNASTASLEVNRKDHQGRTVLHLVVSIPEESSSLEWLELLLRTPGLAVNAVDRESGWTALHRALYAGNVAAARLLLTRADLEPQLKDREGLTAFDLYNSTVSGTNPGETGPGDARADLYTWGSNRNYVLGLPGDNDRTFPEKVRLERSQQALQRRLAQFDPVRVRSVAISRLHSAIVTDEPGNIRMCGFGTGGRIGSNSQTQFAFAPLLDFNHTVTAVALSPDHTVLVTREGAVFTFGSNRFSALGYAIEARVPVVSSTSRSLPHASHDDAIQSIPKRVVGALKRELVLGAAASRSSTIVFTEESVFSWGTNNGQLGYSTPGTKLQITPRKVTLLDVPMIAVSATDNATACLSAAGEVLVLYREIFVRITFPLSRFPSAMQTYRPPQVSAKPNIVKLVSSGTTFLALSSLGDAFSFSLDSSASTSTSDVGSTTPSRIVIKPTRVWSQRRQFTSARDIGIGLDGSVILCTVSGHVYVRGSKRSTSSSSSSGTWTRVPNLQRIVNVTSSNGAFAALRADVQLKEIVIEGPTLDEDLMRIVPHWRRFVTPRKGARVTRSKVDEDEEEADAGIEEDVACAWQLLQTVEQWNLKSETHCAGSDVHFIINISTTGSPVQVFKIPVHRLVLASRSPTLARQLSSAEVSTITLNCSLYTCLLLVHYLYSDTFPAVWDSRIGSRLRELSSTMALDLVRIKQELQELAQVLQLPALARSLTFHVKSPPNATLSRVLSQLRYSAVGSTSTGPDMLLHLADKSVSCHSVILRARSGLFETFFEDPDWARERRGKDGKGTLEFDLRHVRSEVMELVLEFWYTDTGVELFATLERETSDELVEFVVEVISVANELLVDKLKALCSAVLRRFVTLQSLPSLLTDAAYFECHSLFTTILGYLTSSLETFLLSHLLDDLSPALIHAAGVFVREQQGGKMPLVRSGLLVMELMEKHSGWLGELDYGRVTGGAQKFIMNEANLALTASGGPAGGAGGGKGKGKGRKSPASSPRLRPTLVSPVVSPSLPPLREALVFEMDEDFSLDPPASKMSISAATSLNVGGWTRAGESTSRTDFRSILAAEAAERPTRASTPSTSTNTPLSTSVPKPVVGWRALDAPSPSFLSIQSSQVTVPVPRAPVPPAASRAAFALRPAASPIPLAPTRASTIITPTRQVRTSLASGSGGGSGSGFGAADVPWTNYTAPPSPAFPASFAPATSPTLTSSAFTPPTAAAPTFASIQSQQQAANESYKTLKAPRSFAVVIAQEQAEAKEREERAREREEERAFAIWWDAEAERERERERDAAATAAAVTASLAGRHGVSRGKARNRGAPAGAGAGAGRGGRGGNKVSSGREGGVNLPSVPTPSRTPLSADSTAFNPNPSAQAFVPSSSNPPLFSVAAVPPNAQRGGGDKRGGTRGRSTRGGAGGRGGGGGPRTARTEA